MFNRQLSSSWRLAAVSLSVAAMCLTIAATAAAQPQSRRTTVTFSAPVEIPGISAQVLPAGTYVFKLLDTFSDRNVVQIFNKDESHIYATILAIPNYRLKATNKTVMTFAERAAGEPQAIRAWFYPGDSWGQEFVYPKSRAVALAAETHVPVLYLPDEAAANLVAPARTVTDPPVVALKEVPVKAVAPTGADVPLTNVIEAPPVPAPATLPTRLPKTAGVLPLLALFGGLCLGLGLVGRAMCVR